MLKKTGILAGILGYRDAKKTDSNPEIAQTVREIYGLRPDANIAMQNAAAAELSALSSGLTGAGIGGAIGLITEKSVPKAALLLGIPAYLAGMHKFRKSPENRFGERGRLQAQSRLSFKKLQQNPALVINDYGDYEYLNRDTLEPIPRTDPVYTSRPSPSRIGLGRKLFEHDDYNEDKVLDELNGWLRLGTKRNQGNSYAH